MVQSSFQSAALRLVWVGALLAGCDTTPPPIRIDAGPDAGPRDAGRMPDTGPVPDAGPVDASDAEAPSPDGGAATCVVDPERVYKLGTDPTNRTEIVGLAAGASSFAVVWPQLPASGGGITELHGERLTSTGVRGTTQRITSRLGVKRAAAVTAVGTSWVVAWVDNASDAFELRTMGLGADLAPGAATVHDLTATPTLSEDNTVFLHSSAGPMLAWVEDDMAALTRVARAQRVASDGTPMGTPGTASSSGQRPGQLATGELDGGPVLIWSEGIGGSAAVYLQGITTSGGTRGARARVNTEDNADGTVDAALLPGGGAVVFGVLVEGVRREVRFREVPPDGAPTAAQPERVLAAGTGASIARFAGGYAVSYRAPASGETPAQVHLMLVDVNGDVLADLPVLDAAADGARTTVRVSGDGQIAIAWADRAAAGTDVRAAVVRCGVAP